MLKLGIEDWKKRIDAQFDAGLYENVTVEHSVTTDEITNFEYCLEPKEVVLMSEQVDAPIEEEYAERSFIFMRTDDMYKYFEDCLHTRKAAFVNNYDGKDNHCISYFQFYMRGNLFNMNVYVRSMNFVTNFVFDNQTFTLAYNRLYERLRGRVSRGYIRVFVFSLHKYVRV